MPAPSLGRRLVVAGTAVTAIAMGIAALGAWGIARWQHDRLLDRLLQDLVRHLPPAPGEVPPPRDHVREDDPRILVLVVDAQGRARLRTPSLLRQPAIEAGLRALPDGPPRTWRSPQGRLLRVAMQLRHEGRAVIARDVTDEERDLDRLALILGLTWLVATLLALIGTTALRRAMVSPVDRMSRGIQTLAVDDPQARLAAEVPLELQPVVERINGLLDRLEAVRQHERRSHAEIAHELRTPIAALRVALEFAGEDPLARRCLPTVLAMQRLMADLLLLARLDSGASVTLSEPMDLAALVREIAADLQSQAAARRQRLRCEARGSICTSRELMRLVLMNLLGNAIDHAPPESEIEVLGDGSHLTVVNPVAQPPTDLEAMFLPFWRGDSARSGDGQHAGLGLALCRRILACLGGTIEASLPAAHRLAFTVRFPSTNVHDAGSNPG